MNFDDMNEEYLDRADTESGERICPYCNVRPLGMWRRKPGKTCGNAECQKKSNRERAKKRWLEIPCVREKDREYQRKKAAAKRALTPARYCAGVNDDGTPCNKRLETHNRSGYCAPHYPQSQTNYPPKTNPIPHCIGVNKDGSICDAPLRRNNKAGYCKSHRHQMQSHHVTRDKNRADEKAKKQAGMKHTHCIGILKGGAVCGNRLNTNNKSGYCYHHINQQPDRIAKTKAYRQSDRAKEYQRAWRKSPQGRIHAHVHFNAADIDLCIADATKDARGRPICIYSGVPLRVEGKIGKGKACAEHIDAELKGTNKDGPDNWVIAEWNVNTSKSDRCLFEWHESEHRRLGLRPLDAILTDMRRLGKTIPPRRV